MWTFNSPSFTNAVYGSGSIAPVLGAAVQSSGAIAFTNATTFRFNPHTLAPTNTGTLVARFRSRSVAESWLLYWAQDYPNNHFRLQAYNAANQGRIVTVTGGSVVWDTLPVYTSNTWIIVGITWTNNDFRAYHLREGATTVTQTYAIASGAINWRSGTGSTVEPTLGAFRATNGTYPYIGDLDELRIYSGVCSSNEMVGIIGDMPWGN
jgi:hypothetical protein